MKNFDCNTRFTMVSLQPYSGKKCGRYCRFTRKMYIFVSFAVAKLKVRNAEITFAEKPQIK